MDFEISRLHTDYGIFRLQGQVNDPTSDVCLQYTSADFMGTDGWTAMDLNATATQNLLSKLEIEVLEHLKPSS